MNHELRKALNEIALRVAREVRELPRDLLQELVKDAELARAAPIPPEVRPLFENAVNTYRLVLQWANQANEQLIGDKDAVEMTKRAAPHLVDILLGKKPKL